MKVTHDFARCSTGAFTSLDKNVLVFYNNIYNIIKSTADDALKVTFSSCVTFS